MSISIDVTFVISVKHKQKMYLALERDELKRLSFFRTTILEYDDDAGLVELKRTMRSYIHDNVVPLLSAKVGIKMHEFLNSARATIYIEILSKEQLKLKNLKLVTPERARGMTASPEVDMFLHQFFQEKNRIMLEALLHEGVS